MRMFCVGHMVAAGLVCSVVVAGANAGVVKKFQLFDHPDGNKAPPTYGVRLDDLFGDGETTTFSFNTDEGVFLTVTEDSESSSGIVINISGVVFGGVDEGSHTSPHDAGTGTYQLDFTYGVNAAADGTGWVVAPPSPLNRGSITAIDLVNGNDDIDDYSFDLFESTGTNPFKFLQDDYRLHDYPQEDEGYWVGRGWLAFDPSTNSHDTQDFLFIAKEVDEDHDHPNATVVPLPTPLAMGFAGLAGIAGLRRRRS
jgi:MYXO-CTERM domain-containing protein